MAHRLHKNGLEFFNRFLWYLKWFLVTIPKGGVVDIPDKRDLLAGPPRSVNVKLPKKINLLEKAKKLGYISSLQTKNSCTAFQVIGYIEVINTIQNGSAVFLDAIWQWDIQKLGGGSDEKGDSLQNALKTFLKNDQGYKISEYRRLRNKKDLILMKKWLARGVPIYTGVYWKLSADKESGWTLTKLTGIFNWFMGKVLGAHATTIVGYDDEKQHVICFDRLRKNWGKNVENEFYIKYSDIEQGHTMSQYIIFDTIDKKPKKSK